MKAAWDTMVALKLVWFRTLMFLFLPILTTAITQTETWSGDTWDHTHPFIKWRLLAVCCVPGIMSLIAFIDQSLARAKNEIEAKRNATGQTEFFTKTP